MSFDLLFPLNKSLKRSGKNNNITFYPNDDALEGFSTKRTPAHKGVHKSAQREVGSKNCREAKKDLSRSPSLSLSSFWKTNDARSLHIARFYFCADGGGL